MHFIVFGLQWVIRNNTVHLQPREYPTLLSETTRELQQLTTEDRVTRVRYRVSLFCRNSFLQSAHRKDSAFDGLTILVTVVC